MSIWTTIFGRWNGFPWQKPKRLDQTNPCTAAVQEWLEDSRSKGLNVGWVQYFRDRRPWEPHKPKKERWHKAGTYIGPNGLEIYDVINDEVVTLSDTEKKEAVYAYLKP